MFVIAYSTGLVSLHFLAWLVEIHKRRTDDGFCGSKCAFKSSIALSKSSSFPFSGICRKISLTFGAGLIQEQSSLFLFVCYSCGDQIHLKVFWPYVPSWCYVYAYFRVRIEWWHRLNELRSHPRRQCCILLIYLFIQNPFTN